MNAPDPAAGAGHAAAEGVGSDPPDQERLHQLADEEVSRRSPGRSGGCFPSIGRAWAGCEPDGASTILAVPVRTAGIGADPARGPG